jgi:endonuclease YncB( thermonuclease family)
VSALLELQRALAADPMVRAVEPLRVIDGDTFVCQVDLGFYTWTRQSCRLAGLNCAELNEPGGPETRTELQQLLGLGPVVVRSVAVDKFSGRFDAEVLAGPPVGEHGPPVNVNAYLVAQGWAVPWDGKGKKPPVPWPRRPQPTATPLLAQWVDLAA